MPAEVKDRQTGIYYLDPLPKLTSNKEELQAYRYCVIDGECFTDRLEPSVLPDGRYGFLDRSVCVGPVEKVKQKIQDRENGVVTPSPDRRQSDSSGVTKSFVTPSPSEYIPLKKIKVKKNNFVTPGRPKKQLPEKEIIKLAGKGASVRALAKQYNVSHMTIQRILNGQRVLV